MPLSVRLDKKTESLLEETALTCKKNKTEIIKESLSYYCTRVLGEKRRRPYDLIRDLLEKGGSGRGNLSIKSEEILRARFRRRP